MADLTFRERCALVALEAYAPKLFESAFGREAVDAGLEPHELLVSYCWSVADEMEKQKS